MYRKIFIFTILFIILSFVTSCNKEVKVISFSISPETLEMYSSESSQIVASISYSGTDSVYMNWSSSNPAVASVNEYGVVTAHMQGSADIRVECEGYSGVCAVTVIKEVYIAGYEEINGTNIVQQWTGGKINSITGSSLDSYAYTTIAPEGIVYIGGKSKTNDDISLIYHASLWKNGVLTTLDSSENNSVVYDLALKDKSVMAVGSLGESAVLWRDNNASILNSGNAVAKAIALSGDKVIICGYSTYNNTSSNALLWTDGIEQVLAGTNAKANDVAIYNDKVFVVGYTVINGKRIATLWTNGSPAYISGTDIESDARGIAIDGEGSPVICGYVMNNGYHQGVVWKENSPTYLSSGITDVIAESIALSGDVFYVVGNEIGYDLVHNINLSRSLYWENENMSPLTTGVANSGVYSIFIR